MRFPAKDVRSASELSESYVTSGEVMEGFADHLGMSGEFLEESMAVNRGSMRDSSCSMTSVNMDRYVRQTSAGRVSHKSAESSMHVVEEVVHFRDKEAMMEEIIRLRRALSITSRELLRTEAELEDVLGELLRERGKGES